MSLIPSISDAFKSVVEQVEADITADNSLNWGTLPKKVYFKQGTLKEINTVLTAYSTSQEFSAKKYPLICLIRDVKESLELQQYGLATNFKCRLLIINFTLPAYRADDRELLNFKPILLPIFESLIRQIGKSKNFGMPTVKDMQITKYDCYFYGSSENNKNIFNDYVDAIDIESITLRLKNIC